MNAMLLNGAPGAGKSLLMARCRALLPQGAMRVIDPLRTYSWTEPFWVPVERIGCRVIAFDHVEHLPDAQRTMDAAAMWCLERGISLWLSHKVRGAAPRLLEPMARWAIEMHLASFDPERGYFWFSRTPLETNDVHGAPQASALLPVLPKDFLSLAGVHIYAPIQF